MASETKHPGALLYLAKNYESGVMTGSLEDRVTKSIEAYEDILKGVLATSEERIRSSLSIRSYLRGI